jgi:hypothetical protein
METIRFNTVGLDEMTSIEIQSINGGLMTNPVWMASALIALGASIINNWGDIREGWADGNSNSSPRH